MDIKSASAEEYRDYLAKKKDFLREAFKKQFPDISEIRQVDIHKLIYLLDEAFRKHALLGNLSMYMQPLNRFTANMIREKGIPHKGLTLKVGASYFSDRDAIQFSKEGKVYFCSWASHINNQPFLDAFEEWLQSYK